MWFQLVKLQPHFWIKARVKFFWMFLRFILMSALSFQPGRVVTLVEDHDVSGQSDNNFQYLNLKLIKLLNASRNSVLFLASRQ